MKFLPEILNKIIKIDKNKPDLNLIQTAGDYIKNGALVVIPTETVYGIACNALIEDSLKKIYDIKKRPYDKPFSFHFGDIEDFFSFAGKGLDARQKEIFVKLKNESVTLVYYDSLKEKKIGIRFPSNKVAKLILRYAKCPVIATSVNFSGETACISVDSMNNEILKNVDLIIDSHICEKSMESTVIDISEETFKVLREGAFKL